ncbi:MAG: acetyl-CoA carboxylase biotin carboxylase subunit [Granulosicoccus sp.]
MFSRILIANRGEIAVRIIRTAHRLGIETVAVYSDADKGAMHVKLADQAICIGPPPVAQSYLQGGKIIQAALYSGALAIHPGYGFLSENPEFVDAVVAAGLIFIGPSAQSIRAMGLKDSAKTLMQDAGVPVVPGYHGGNQDPEMLAREAEKIGYPVMIKARAGGGGKGMRLVESADTFAAALNSAAREADTSFGDSSVLIEKFISHPRHIEIQLFGDNHGNIVHLFERDCSLQRRHQKVVEEAPAPGMTTAVRSAMTDAAITAARAINYSGAGTVEFIVDGSGPLRKDGFWFMEMNTRLQVEHPVTEAITGIDLVEAQLRVASNEFLPFDQKKLAINGHAMETRLYAEDVRAGFLPATGKIHHFSFGEQVRVDTGVSSGDTITPYYDPMIAKIITYGPTRAKALSNMHRALENTHVAGTTTNIDFLRSLVLLDDFGSGNVDTELIERNVEQLCEKDQPDGLSKLLAAIVLNGINPDYSLLGWRQFGDASHLFDLTNQQKTAKCRLVLGAHGSVQLKHEHGDETICRITVTDVTDRMVCFVLDGCRLSAKIHHWKESGHETVSILINGNTHVFQKPDGLVGTEQGSQNADSLVAPMTGIVRLVDVVVGQDVSKGERLMVMEAMKMESSLFSPRSGIVESINCSVGDSVEGGAVLIRLQELRDDPA